MITNQSIWKEVCDEIYNGKIGIWLNKLNAWAKDSDENVYKYKNIEKAKKMNKLFYFDHGGEVKEFK